MRRKSVFLGIILLVAAAFGLFLRKTQWVYTNHHMVVNDTIAELLENVDDHLPIPKQRVDLHGINRHPSPDMPLFEVIDWHVENVALANTVSVGQAIMDDDPIYRLQADIKITYADGRQATLAWESWRYGIVIGPLVLSLGDGPPGYIVATATQ